VEICDVVQLRQTKKTKLTTATQNALSHLGNFPIPMANMGTDFKCHVQRKHHLFHPLFQNKIIPKRAMEYTNKAQTATSELHCT
jgi:hypothetical protein